MKRIFAAAVLITALGVMVKLTFKQARPGEGVMLVPTESPLP